MMKSRLFLKSSTKAARNSLITLLLLTFLAGCSASPRDYYTKGNLASSLEKILEDEYKIPIKAHLSGSTLWVYIPLKESIFIESDKPQQYTKKFEINFIDGNIEEGTFGFKYHIRETPEMFENQKKKFNPAAFEKINKVLRGVRRVLFNIKPSKDCPRFFVTAAADTKNGIELIDTAYVDDLKKASYEMISWVEYQHRTIENIVFSPLAVGDETGEHLFFYDIDFQEFLIDQIKQRVRVKFNRPEVDSGADIDMEILKSISQVIRIYKFKDFLLLELKNLITGNRIYRTKSSVMEGIKK